MWNLPGGKVELGEAPWEAVIREVEEETGLIVRVERLLGVYAVPRKSDVVFDFPRSQKGGALRTPRRLTSTLGSTGQTFLRILCRAMLSELKMLIAFPIWFASESKPSFAAAGPTVSRAAGYDTPAMS